MSVLGHEPARRKPAFLSSLFVLPESSTFPESRIGSTSRRAPPSIRTSIARASNVTSKSSKSRRGGKLSSLSHGEQKKFLLSFGLATKASLLLLDEPTNGLDIPSKGLFRRLVAEALVDDRIFVVSTHQVRDVEALIDSILVLHEGKVLFHGSVPEVSNRIRFSLDSSRPDERSAGLLYAEPTVGGFASVWMDPNAGDGHLGLEMLFKAVIARPDDFAALFEKEVRA